MHCVVSEGEITPGNSVSEKKGLLCSNEFTGA
jgi:hypothetical protein